MLLDRYLPEWDVRSHHETVVDAAPDRAYRAARSMDLGRSWPVSALVAVRSIPYVVTGKIALRRSLTLDSMIDAGFTILAEEVDREIVLGAIGRFWLPTSGFKRIVPDEFESFSEPGFAKAAMNLAVAERGPGRTLLSTETRVLCTDESARRRFGLYWRAIGPFSGVIRHLMLREIRSAAE